MNSVLPVKVLWYHGSMNDIEYLTGLITSFRDDRDWKQFHNLKDMALSLTLEAAEVLEQFQWKQETEFSVPDAEEKDALAEELSDVLYWVLLMAHDAQIDMVSALTQKMEKNRANYPVHLARGSKEKYTALKAKARAKGE